MLKPNFSPKRIETHSISKSGRDLEKKVWPFYSNLPERNDINGPGLQSTRPRPIKGTLVGSSELNPWRDSQETDVSGF